MISYRFKRFLRERNEFSKTGEETLLSVSEFYGVKPRSLAFADEEHESRAESLEGYRIVKAGDLVMNYMLAWKGAYGISDHDGIVSPAYAVFDVDERFVDRRFLHHRTRSDDMKALFRSGSKGIIESRLRLYPDSLLATFVDLPDLASQQRIADFLDAETARIDTLIAKKQRLLSVLDERLDQLVRASVTGQAPANGRRHELVDSGIDYLGRIPKTWCINKVGLRYHIQLGKMLDDAKQTGQHKRPYLRVADVQWGQINTENLPEMDFKPSDQKKFSLQKGDLIVNEGGSYVGRSAIWNGELAECYYQKALHRVRALRPADDSVAFLYYIMRFATKAGVFVAGGNQTTIDHLTAEAFARYRFAFPKFEEQREIATALRDAEMKHATLRSSIESSIDRLREYRAALITAAVTGQIDVASHARQVKTVPQRAGADVGPLYTSPQPMSAPDRRDLRVLVAADVVHRLGADPYLGRTKLQKLMFLAEAHANINDIAGRYQRYRYGPYDDAMVQEIELGLRQDGYYDTREGTGVDREKVAFQQMSRAGGHRDALAAALGGQTERLRQLVDLFKGKDTEATEAVATLYAVWNDALIDGMQPDDAAIIRGFLQDWHPEKSKFKQADLLTWLGWMRRHGIIPHGSGPRTISTSTPSLFESE